VMTSGRERFLIGWAYIVELVAAYLLYLLVSLVFGALESESFICRTSSVWATACGIAVGVAATVWVAFFSVLGTPFGSELRSRGAASVYSTALAAPIFVFFVATVLFMLLPTSCTGGTGDKIGYHRLAQISIFLGVYSVINFVTLVRNVIQLIKLWEHFDGNSNNL
jgi:hypothetical protein